MAAATGTRFPGGSLKLPSASPAAGGPTVYSYSIEPSTHEPAMRDRSTTCLKSLALAALLAAAPVQSSLAKLYKWVDENGNVTYSERKPPDRQAEEIRVRSAPVSDDEAKKQLESLKEKARGDQDTSDSTTAAAGQTKEAAEQYKKNCEIARENQRVLKNSARVKTEDNEGKQYFLEPAQIQAKLEQTAKQIELYCK